MNATRIIPILVITILLCSFVSAKTYHMTLLTVGEVGEELFGGTADAYLELKPGSGRIFLDSFPLTKIDTQISTRYANRIACDYLEANCENYDFFYTIRADSTIVGGPSASGPLTILTIAALEGKDPKNDTVMTGTINSGGSIGPVGGVSKKAEAAQKAGFKRVLVPRFAIEDKVDNASNPLITSIVSITTNNQTNSTSSSNLSAPIANIVTDTALDRINNTSPIEVIQISNLDEAIPYFLEGVRIEESGEIILPEDYATTMENISNMLCSKAREQRLRLALNETENNRTIDFEAKINVSLSQKNYYSAASYCFNMGVYLRRINLRKIAEEDEERLSIIRDKTSEVVFAIDKNLEDINITTLTQLEAYIIVKERVIESRDLLLGMNGNVTPDELAYAIERYYSAVYWSAFFNMKGKPISLDQQYLEEACYKKLSEAEERINYAQIYLPSILDVSRDNIDEAYAYSEDENYKMCLFKASFAKAEANLLLSSLSVENDEIVDLAMEKIRAAKKLIARQETRGFFPVLGYSYYEYSNSLISNKDEISSLIFSEYSLELSNLEMYFPKKKEFGLPTVDYALVALITSVFLFGLAVGAFIMTMFFMKKEMQKAELVKKPVSRKRKK